MRTQPDQPRKAFKESYHSEFPQSTIPAKKVFRYQNKPVLDLNPITLKRQSLKRRDITKCQFNSRSLENYEDSMMLTLAIKSLKKTKNRKITFHLDWIIIKNLHFLTESLKRSPLLQNIHLDFDDSQITNESLSDLCKTLKRIPFVKKLNLNFYECHSLEDQGLNSLSHGLRTLSNLQTISLKFGGCHQITNVGSGYIGKVLCPSLENVQLDFSECEITDMGLEFLNSGFKKIIRLKEILLNFYCCEVSESKLEKMKGVLENLSSFPKIRINNGEEENKDEVEDEDDEDGDNDNENGIENEDEDANEEEEEEDYKDEDNFE